MFSGGETKTNAPQACVYNQYMGWRIFSAMQTLAQNGPEHFSKTGDRFLVQKSRDAKSEYTLLFSSPQNKTYRLVISDKRQAAGECRQKGDDVCILQYLYNPYAVQATLWTDGLTKLADIGWSGEVRIAKKEEEPLICSLLPYAIFTLLGLQDGNSYCYESLILKECPVD